VQCTVFSRILLATGACRSICACVCSARLTALVEFCSQGSQVHPQLTICPWSNLLACCLLQPPALEFLRICFPQPPAGVPCSCVFAVKVNCEWKPLGQVQQTNKPQEVRNRLGAPCKHTAMANLIIEAVCGTQVVSRMDGEPVWQWNGFLLN
jgi:hypothetical protein